MKPLLILILILGQKFYPDDPVKHDNDAAVEVRQITNHKLSHYYDVIQHTFGKPGDRARPPAANVNTLGEVPDSSWFHNRHGSVRMSRGELVRGPDSGPGPSAAQPWKVVRVKSEGVTPGLLIRDPNGDEYLIKFDSPDHPELATAAEVISTKFFHAIGFNVPENYLVLFGADQLQPDGKVTPADIKRVLSRVHRSSRGTYRAVASKLLKGAPAGPFQYFGTRPDDPNDIFPHENRRELRGLRVFSAWLNHTDAKASNSLDMLVDDGQNRYLRHYLIDFGSTLGSGGVGPQKPRYGWEYLFEADPALKRFVTFGLWDRQWVAAKYPQTPSVGRFESAQFDPMDWRPHYPNPAFRNLTAADAYWAAKIVMAFTNSDIRAIVQTGRLSDPRAEAYIVETLIERRDKIGRTWLTQLSSFDRFRLTDGGDLSFDHLASAYGFSTPPAHRISWFRYDNLTDLRRPIQGLPAGGEGYFAAAISSEEGDVTVYVRSRNGRRDIVGIER